MSGDPIRLFVGTSANGEDLEAEMVLEYSARMYCTRPLEIVWMRQAAEGPWSGWACRSGRTPFTHFRWSVPAVCGFKGRALYTDVDFIFVGDLAELWAQPIPSVGLVRNPSGKLTTSCILFDCAHARSHIPGLEGLRRMPDAHGFMLNYFRSHQGLLTAQEGNWDCPDLKGAALTDADLRAIHYTRIEHQLHLKYAVPRLQSEGRSHWYKGVIKPHPRPELVDLFDHLYDAARDAGYTAERYQVPPFERATRKPFVYRTHVGVSA